MAKFYTEGNRKKNYQSSPEEFLVHYLDKLSFYLSHIRFPKLTVNCGALPLTPKIRVEGSSLHQT